MEHLEDSVFNAGSKGVKDAVQFLNSVMDMLRGSAKSGVNITVKWDGAPAIFCGKNPENGKFFVATKSLFNKTPKINYTHDDIRANHSGGLVDRLHVALNHLSKLGIDGIVQGDMMFMNDDLESESIDGEEHITFTPNTITYAVPKDSDLAKRIERARIGIVFHTKYSGRTIDVATKKSGRFLDKFVKNNSVIGEIKIYINANVRQGVSTGNIKGFMSYMDSKLQKAVDKVKKPNAIKRKELQKDKINKPLMESLNSIL